METTKTMKKSWYQLPVTWFIAIVAVAVALFFVVDGATDLYEEVSEPVMGQEGVPAEFTETLEVAHDLMATVPYSYEALHNFLVFYGHDADAIEWTMAQIDAETDWYAQAVAYGQYLLDYGYEEDELFDSIMAEWFTESQATFAVETLTQS